MAKYHDNNSYPVERRGEPCSNCGKTWGHHAGWNCDDTVHKSRSRLKLSDQYLTVDMQADAVLMQLLKDYDAKGDACYPFPTKCGCCKHSWDAHDGVFCPTNTGETFIPPTVATVSNTTPKVGDKLLLSIQEGQRLPPFPFQVVCLDNGSREEFLTVGATYTATHDASTDAESAVGERTEAGPDLVLEGIDFTFAIRRFALAPITAKAAPATPADTSDWKVWRDINNQGNCPCGIPLHTTCIYHP